MICVYKHYDAEGELLYIGSTVKFPTRTRDHEKTARWFRHLASIKIERFDNIRSALAREKELIDQKKPPFNTTHDRSKVIALSNGVPSRSKIIEMLREYLANASVLEALEFIEMAGIHTSTAIEVLKGTDPNHLRTLLRIESVLYYLKRKKS